MLGATSQVAAQPLEQSATHPELSLQLQQQALVPNFIKRFGDIECDCAHLLARGGCINPLLCHVQE